MTFSTGLSRPDSADEVPCTYRDGSQLEKLICIEMSRRALLTSPELCEWKLHGTLAGLFACILQL